MTRCEMIWTTAGVIRTCPRCPEINGKIIGYTDEVGVQLPPLHPRCRCAIVYREAPTTRGLAASKEIHFNEGGISPYKIGQIDARDAAQVKQVLDWAEPRIAAAPIENALIITKTGEIYHCTGGLNSLDKIIELGEKLIGATVTHNHPLGSDNEYSFSDADLRLFLEYKLGRLRGVDEKFIYEFNRNPKDRDVNNFTYEDVTGDSLGLLARHIRVIDLAGKNKIGYRRWAK